MMISLEEKEKRLLDGLEYGDDLKFDDGAKNDMGYRMNYMDDVFRDNPDLLMKLKKYPKLIKELDLPSGMKSLDNMKNSTQRANEK